MRIDINATYVITSDADNYTVSTKGTYKSDQKVVDGKEGAKSGDELLKAVGYVHTLEQAFRFLLQRQIRESSASGFQQVLAEVKRIEKELKLAIAI